MKSNCSNLEIIKNFIHYLQDIFYMATLKSISDIRLSYLISEIMMHSKI